MLVGLAQFQRFYTDTRGLGRAWGFDHPVNRSTDLAGSSSTNTGFTYTLCVGFSNLFLGLAIYNNNVHFLYLLLRGRTESFLMAADGTAPAIEDFMPVSELTNPKCFATLVIDWTTSIVVFRGPTLDKATPIIIFFRFEDLSFDPTSDGALDCTGGRENTLEESSLSSNPSCRVERIGIRFWGGRELLLRRKFLYFPSSNSITRILTVALKATLSDCHMNSSTRKEKLSSGVTNLISLWWLPYIVYL